MSTLTSNDVRGLMEAYQAVYAPQELNEVEFWVNSLLEEGYDLSEYTWEEMYDTYLVNEFNTIVDGLIKEGYDLSEYTEQELFDALISERRQFAGALKDVWNMFPEKNLPKQLGLPKPPSSRVPYGNRTLSGTPSRPALPAARGTGAPPSRGGALVTTKPNSSSLVTTKPNSSSLATTKPNSSSLTAPSSTTGTRVRDMGPTSPSKPLPNSIRMPGGPAGNNNNGKKAAAAGLGLLGLGALTSLQRPYGQSTTVPGTGKPGNSGPSRRKEQLVGQGGDLRATDPVMADAKKLNQQGGISLGKGGTGYLAQKGGKLVTVQAKGIGADDGIIGQAARKLGLTKDKDKALEAQRQDASRKNRELYLQGQGLTDPNVTGYQAKGAIRKGKETGLNIKSSYEYDQFDVVLEHLLDEGFADTNESALAIMANMSEEWREEILEAGRMHSASDQQASWYSQKYGNNSKPKSDDEIQNEKGEKEFLKRISKTKKNPKYRP